MAVMAMAMAMVMAMVMMMAMGWGWDGLTSLGIHCSECSQQIVHESWSVELCQSNVAIGPRQRSAATNCILEAKSVDGDGWGRKDGVIVMQVIMGGMATMNLTLR